jgi:alpha-1,3-fucosyltransferase 10
MQHMDVHSYGSVLNNRTMPDRDCGSVSKRSLLSGYRFNLAFENSICTDYVTEKLYDPLRSGCVPVYLGAPNVSRFVPGEHCCVDVRDYASPRHLADYLRNLAGNNEAYAAYFAWKTKPFRREFLRIAEECGEPLGVRLCRKLQ